ncbi:protein I'm not dead yet-like [Copidosoma floridanum]|uniref:protein I'm not dead yet-like n=1 Tax=Copidosoma floridanum TaxID=29053 RepID=UPI0006C9AB29|nr:protein I'm not dead yet-like [Copidosoma floridanum]
MEMNIYMKKLSKWNGYYLVTYILMLMAPLTGLVSDIAFANILLPFILIMESRCGYVVLLMAGYWVTECLPLPMTALMPIVLFPCLNILSIKDTCECYMNDLVMYFIGSQILAIAIEHSKLHLRVALKIMQVFGYTHKRLLAGTILATTFLSMWITSATATAMMVPIVLTILSELERVDIGKVFHNLRNPEDANSGPIPTKVTMAYLLGMAYAATFGGTATLFGTATNLVFKGIFEQVFLCAPKIGFDQWMLYSAPLAYANAFITWLYLIVMYFGEVEPNGHYASIDTIGSEGANTVKRVLKEKYDDLGKVTTHEVGVAITYITVVVLLLTRKPGFATGWVDIIPGRKIPESAPMILVLLLMFLIPRDLNFLNICSTDENKIPKAPSKSLIAWKLVETKIPWGLMFLLGAGVAMSQAIKKSGLAETLEKSMTPVQSLSAFDVLVIVCIIVGTITEVTPEIARANIMLPVVASMY